MTALGGKKFLCPFAWSRIWGRKEGRDSSLLSFNCQRRKRRGGGKSIVTTTQERQLLLGNGNVGNLVSPPLHFPEKRQKCPFKTRRRHHFLKMGEAVVFGKRRNLRRLLECPLDKGVCLLEINRANKNFGSKSFLYLPKSFSYYRLLVVCGGWMEEAGNGKYWPHSVFLPIV